MNEYIFYTTEGHTYCPRKNTEIENCQVLGYALGENPKEAMLQLEINEPWISECGFDINKAIYKQIVNNNISDSLKFNSEIINFLKSLLNRRQLKIFDEWMNNR